MEPNRRDFLHPRQLVETAGQALGAVAEPSSPSSPEYALLRVSRRAMATSFEVVLPYGTPDALAQAEAALDLVNRLEDQLTVYHEASEVSRLNRDAAERPVTVEDRLFELLRLAGRITEETGGAFDVTAGPLIKAWGFFRRQGRVPSPEERAEVLQRVGMRHVEFDVDRRTVRFAQRGLEINLGSIGKGYALDRVAELLRQQWGLASVLLHGGQSSVLALGAAPGDGRGWPVGIQHPWEAGKRLAVVRLQDRAMATSGATYQHLEYNGKKLGHILDPRTGWPAEGIASATAIAPTAAWADALATAFFILGVDQTRDYCRKHPEVGAVLLPEGAERPFVMGLRPEEVEVAA